MVIYAYLFFVISIIFMPYFGSWCSFRQPQLILHLMGMDLQNQQMMTCLVWWHVLITWNFLLTLPRYCDMAYEKWFLRHNVFQPILTPCLGKMCFFLSFYCFYFPEGKMVQWKWSPNNCGIIKFLIILSLMSMFGWD